MSLKAASLPPFSGLSATAGLSRPPEMDCKTIYLIINYDATLVLVVMRGGWKGNLSLNRLSKWKRSMLRSKLCEPFTADLSISS